MIFQKIVIFILLCSSSHITAKLYVSNIAATGSVAANQTFNYFVILVNKGLMAVTFDISYNLAPELHLLAVTTAPDPAKFESTLSTGFDGKFSSHVTLPANYGAVITLSLKAPESVTKLVYVSSSIHVTNLPKNVKITEDSSFTATIATTK